MIGPRTSREDDEYARVVYPGTSVYVNKLDIRDQASLEKIERYLSATRADQGFPSRAHFRSYAGFKAIHRHLFQDLYAWVRAPGHGDHRFRLMTTTHSSR